MEGMTLGEIARVVRGRLLTGRPESPVAGISIDSRALRSGELFWALPGERFDGHDFVAEALRAGAVGAVISRREVRAQIEAFQTGPAPTSACLLVTDSLRALQDLAQYRRRLFSIPLVGITGSNGKTTTKELIAAVLEGRLAVHKTQGNFNNLIGLPLTLLGLSSRHQVAVVEMGMNRPGEIEALCRIALPTLGVITNIGGAHLEFLGTMEAIQQAKGELVRALRKEHTLVVNADDPRVVALGDGFAGRRIAFGIDAAATVRARQVREQGVEGTHFLLSIEGREVPIRLRLMGRHNVSNALAAAAVGHALSLEIEEIRRGLEGFGGMKMRMQVHRLESDVLLIDDSYNANPVSMEAAFRTLAGILTPPSETRATNRGAEISTPPSETQAPNRGTELLTPPLATRAANEAAEILTPPAATRAANGAADVSIAGRALVVIGDMLELGAQSEACHRDLGRLVVELGIDQLITVGPAARLAAEEAHRRGMAADRIAICRDHPEGARALMERLRPGDRVLVKGSRGSAMEKVVQAVMQKQKE